MLVLSRYRDESIYIGDDVIVTIVDIRGDRVRLGIQAPANVSVHRQEIYDAIRRERDEPEISEPPAREETQQRSKKTTSPLGKKVEDQKNKGLPIDIDTPTIGFGGISDIVSQ